MRVGSNEIESICDLVLDLCGVYLDADKAYLIEARLGEVAKRHGCTSYGDMVDRVRRTSDLRLKTEIVDAITTNETLFFRDSSLFKAFTNKALPELIDSKERSAFPRRLRIWSAAASTGQEAYSIAMSIRELIPDISNWDIHILGTDVSDAAIAKASRGRYTAKEVERGMSATMLKQYFRRRDNDWVIEDRVRSMVSFRTFNLHDTFDSLGKFDFIFCRNVAIYFTPEARRSLFERLTKNLVNQGCLFVGSSEMLTSIGPQFVPLTHCGSIFYQPNAARSLS